MNDERLFMMLKSKDLSVSHQRLSILDYLVRNRGHPTCEMIYNGLKKSGNPTLSLATVYNNIRTFVDVGIINELEIDSNERHYDIETEEHSHFHCRSCGKILNVELTEELQDKLLEIIEHSVPDCVIERKNVYFSGICPECQENQTRQN
jgi:Fur family peroxide stress response transcriptional regulator